MSGDKTFITDAKDNAELNQLVSDIRDMEKRKAEKLTFLEKQVQTAREEHAKEHKKLWDAVAANLSQRNLFPSEYSKDSHSICLQSKGTQVFIEERDGECDNPLHKLLKGLSGHVIKI